MERLLITEFQATSTGFGRSPQLPTDSPHGWAKYTCLAPGSLLSGGYHEQQIVVLVPRVFASVTVVSL